MATLDKYNHLLAQIKALEQTKTNLQNTINEYNKDSYTKSNSVIKAEKQMVGVLSELKKFYKSKVALQKLLHL